MNRLTDEGRWWIIFVYMLRLIPRIWCTTHCTPIHFQATGQTHSMRTRFTDVSVIKVMFNQAYKTVEWLIFNFWLICHLEELHNYQFKSGSQLISRNRFLASNSWGRIIRNPRSVLLNAAVNSYIIFYLRSFLVPPSPSLNCYNRSSKRS